jgi:ABC-type transport system involved in cytochrome c biogenesis ATPase subunit
MRLLERDREFAAAQGLVNRAVAGAGGLLVIEGPPGIGKTALLQETAGRARAAGVAVRLVHATRLGASDRFRHPANQRAADPAAGTEADINPGRKQHRG